MSENKIACQFCGNKFSKSGVLNHEKSCKLNPANADMLEEERVALEVLDEAKEVSEECAEAEAKAELSVATLECECKCECEEEDQVSVTVNTDIQCYIGNKYEIFTKGAPVEVDCCVKRILERAGLLVVEE